jgi:hypothetical protein
MKPLKYRGRPNRNARKWARRISSPMGKQTWVFSHRHDPQRPALARTGAEVMRWTAALAEMDRRHMHGQQSQISRGMIMEDLGREARKYLQLLHIGEKQFNVAKPRGNHVIDGVSYPAEVADDLHAAMNLDATLQREATARALMYLREMNECSHTGEVYTISHACRPEGRCTLCCPVCRKIAVNRERNILAPRLPA